MVDKKSQIKILNKYKLITNQYLIIPVSEVLVLVLGQVEVMRSSN